MDTVWQVLRMEKVGICGEFMGSKKVNIKRLYISGAMQLLNLDFFASF